MMFSNKIPQIIDRKRVHPMGYHTTSEGAARDVHPFPSAAVRVGTRWQVKKA